MEVSGFELTSTDHKDYRLLRVRLPESVTIQSLSVVIDQYLAFWETDLPIAILNDATQLIELDDEVSAVLLAVLKRNLADPRFLGSAWFTGDNETLDAQLRALQVESGRDPDSILETEEEAMAYIARLVAGLGSEHVGE